MHRFRFLNRNLSLGLRILSYLGVLVLGATLALTLAPRFQSSSVRVDYCGYQEGNLWDMFTGKGFVGTVMPERHAIHGYCEVVIPVSSVFSSQATVAVSYCKDCLVAVGFGKTDQEQVIYVSSRQVSLNSVVTPLGTFTARTAYMLYPAQLWDHTASAPDRGSIHAILDLPYYLSDSPVQIVQALDVTPRLPQVPVVSSLQAAVAQVS